MKKIIAILLSVFCLCGLVGCNKGSVKNVEINYKHSDIYTETDMDEAISIIKSEFKKFKGCELHSISYDSDDKCNTIANIKWMNELSTANGGKGNFTQCIMFEISFHTPDKYLGVFEPDEEYQGWFWWLARTDGGKWQLMTRGYA